PAEPDPGSRDAGHDERGQDPAEQLHGGDPTDGAPRAGQASHRSHRDRHGDRHAAATVARRVVATVTQPGRRRTAVDPRPVVWAPPAAAASPSSGTDRTVPGPITWTSSSWSERTAPGPSRVPARDGSVAALTPSVRSPTLRW